MGGWLLEVARMSMYMAFPVCMFHYFNQPEYFEAWVTKTKQEVYPPENPEQRKAIQDAIKKLNAQHDEQLRKQLEERLKNE